MSQSLSDIILHIVFSTKERRSFIDSNIENELHSYLTKVCKTLDSPVIQINGMPDHVHILLILGKNIALSKLISEIKSNSSRWIKTKGNQYNDFSWQSGYGVFSISRRNIDSIINYISSQKEHHKKITFKDELIKLLKKGNLKFDEKYLWD